MEEIDISQLINFFKSKIIYIIFATAIAFCLSSIYVNRFRVPEYTNSTTILVNQVNDKSVDLQTVNLSKSLIKTYSAIIKSKTVLMNVIDKLDLDMSYEELFSKISVGEVTDTTIIRISVTDEDSKLAADIANSIADEFSEEIVKIYQIENISVIDKAEPSEVASSASTIKIIGISTIAGAFISVAVIFVLFYFDTTIKNEEDIERLTGLPVIGVVPISREKIKYSQHRKYYDDLAKKHKNQEILPIEKEVRKIEILEKPSLKKDNEINPVNQIVNTNNSSNLTDVQEKKLDKTIEEMNFINDMENMRQDDVSNGLTQINVEAIESAVSQLPLIEETPEEKEIIEPLRVNNYKKHNNSKRKYYGKKNNNKSSK